MGKNFPLLLDFNKSGGLGVCNPSLIYEDGKFLVNLRNVNYALYHSIGAKWVGEMKGGNFNLGLDP